jgi:hypothetical protein
MKPCGEVRVSKEVCAVRQGVRVFAYSDEESDGDEEERVGQERVNPEEQDNGDVVAPANWK